MTRPQRSRSYVRPVIHAVCITDLFRRTPIVCSVLGLSASATKRQYNHLLTRSCAFVSPLRVRAGCTSHVRCSYPRYHSPMQSVCASSRASARFPLIAGPQCVTCPSSLCGVPDAKFANQRCTLCNQVGGAVVRCSDCPGEYHISCAWSRGYKFGFEIQPVSPPSFP